MNWTVPLKSEKNVRFTKCYGYVFSLSTSRANTCTNCVPIFIVVDAVRNYKKKHLEDRNEPAFFVPFVVSSYHIPRRSI